MSKDGLTELVVSLMITGGVSAIDAARPAYAHAAVLSALRSPGGKSLPQVFGTEVCTVPDPSVGVRVLGMTQALWSAVSQGWLQPHRAKGQALLILSDTANQDLAPTLSQLDRPQRLALRQAGDAWAANSTDLKKSDSALICPASA